MTQPTPAYPVSAALDSRLSGSPLLALLDIDGTLAPIAPTPHVAAVPQRTRAVVAALARSGEVHVAVVSGRAARDAQSMVGTGGVWVIGNHGMEWIDPRGTAHVHRSVVPYTADIEAASRELEVAVAHIPGVLVEDKGLTASVHYRLAERERVGEVRAIVGHAAAKHSLHITEGKEVLELRPPVEINKGTAAVDLAGELGIDGSSGAVLCAGDDRTDEDAFRALRAAFPRAVTVRVMRDGDAPDNDTAAEYFVRDTEEVRALLEWLAAKRGISVSS